MDQLIILCKWKHETTSNPAPLRPSTLSSFLTRDHLGKLPYSNTASYCQEGTYYCCHLDSGSLSKAN